jgi:hypothetical protein
LVGVEARTAFLSFDVTQLSNETAMLRVIDRREAVGKGAPVAAKCADCLQGSVKI